MTVREPARNPCGSCPYRRDVPSGVWHADEYAKLPPFDRDTAEQPPGVFLCHQQDGRICAGWAGCHDMSQNLGVRIGASMGTLPDEVVEALMDYSTDVPLFASGAEAAEHGMKDNAEPGTKARRTINTLLRKGVARE